MAGCSIVFLNLLIFWPLLLVFGVAYLFITHKFAVVEYLADRVAVMKDGQIVEMGETAELMRAPSTDYCARLLAAVPRLRSKKSQTL